MTHKVSSSKNSRRKPHKAWELLPASHSPGSQMEDTKHQAASIMRPNAIQGKSPRKNGHETSCNRDSRQSNTKQEKILRMLYSESGTTISDIIKETGWQAHSIRAFFSSVVRRRLQLPFQARKINGRRVYFLDP